MGTKYKERTELFLYVIMTMSLCRYVASMQYEPGLTLLADRVKWLFTITRKNIKKELPVIMMIMII